MVSGNDNVYRGLTRILKIGVKMLSSTGFALGFFSFATSFANFFCLLPISLNLGYLSPVILIQFLQSQHMRLFYRLFFDLMHL